MKAVVIENDGAVVYKDIPQPDVRPGTVRIKVAVCGICGSDVPRVFDHTAHSYPIVLGHEFAGVIETVGEGVQGLTVGEHVTAAPLVPCHACAQCRRGNYSLCEGYSFIGSREQGAMAEYVTVPAGNVVKIGESIPFEQAATIEPATVALHGLRLARFGAGRSAAVLGCGIIGLYAVQWAKLLGASVVAAIGRGESGLAAARAAGADAAISTIGCPEGELPAGLDKAGYDYVLECSGAGQTMALALQAVAKKGTVCYVGTPKRPMTFPVRLWENINRKECWVTGAWMSYSAPFPGEEWTMAAEHMATGGLKLVPGMVHKTYPMAEAARAFEDIRNGASGRCLLKNEEI